MFPSPGHPFVVPTPFFSSNVLSLTANRFEAKSAYAHVLSSARGKKPHETCTGYTFHPLAESGLRIFRACARKRQPLPHSHPFPYPLPACAPAHQIATDIKKAKSKKEGREKENRSPFFPEASLYFETVFSPP